MTARDHAEAFTHTEHYQAGLDEAPPISPDQAALLAAATTRAA